jgi:hypothetical protein
MLYHTIKNIIDIVGFGIEDHPLVADPEEQKPQREDSTR